MIDELPDNLKEEFKKWLEQQGYKSSVAKDYACRVQRMVNDFAKSNWKDFSNNIMPLLAIFYEVANKEYYLDRVTAWYAINYFDKISKYIYKKHINFGNYTPKVTLELFDGVDKKNYYPGYNITFEELSNNLRCLVYNMYGYQIDKVNELLALALVQSFKESNKIKLKDAAIHIKYDTKANSQRKVALSRYCDFLYAITSDSVFDYKSNPIFYMVTNNNPKKHIRYKIDKTITGEHAQQIKYNYDPAQSAEILDFALTIENLKNIFMVGITRAKYIITHLKTYDQTVLDKYYSIKATNVCLNEHYHAIISKHTGVNYKLEGYEYWITRKEATGQLKISHNSFDLCINVNNCSYIDYSSLYIRYYKPDVEYLINEPNIVKAQRRKNIYSKNKAVRHKLES